MQPHIEYAQTAVSALCLEGEQATKRQTLAVLDRAASDGQ